jgi:hypothetical protein
MAQRFQRESTISAFFTRRTCPLLGSGPAFRGNQPNAFQLGPLPPAWGCRRVDDKSVVDHARQTFLEYDTTPLAGYMPYTRQTEQNLQKLIDLQPATIAAMHGSTYSGDGAEALRCLGEVMKEVL